MVESYKDFLGNDVFVGDKIVYPGRASSSLWMTYAQVVEILKRPTYYNSEQVVAKVQHLCGTSKDKVVQITNLGLTTKINAE